MTASFAPDAAAAAASHAAAAAGALAAAVDRACDRIAPTWPLDRFIAVDPYWGWRGERIEQAAARLGVLAGTRLTLPRSGFAAWWRRGRLTAEHLQAAIAAEGADVDVSTLIAALQDPDRPVVRLPLIADLLAQPGPGRPGAPWAEVVTHQVSQHCAAWFDHDQASWGPARDAGLYGSWRDSMAADRGIVWRHGRRWMAARVAALPADPAALIAEALRGLGVPAAGHEALLVAVLHAVGGWAAWCAGQRWQARLQGGDDRSIVELLAMRLAWEWLLHDDAVDGAGPPGWAAGWAASWAGAASLADALQAEQATDWLLQRAGELAWHVPLARGLLRAPAKPAEPAPPVMQAVFCIDVRSEVFRRALEAVGPEVATRGFAGFFGLPIAYRPLGARQARPQLPGLLAPAACASDCCDDQNGLQVAQAAQALHGLATRRQRRLQWGARWDAFRAAPGSAFSFVESLGLTYAPRLLGASLPRPGSHAHRADAGLGDGHGAGLGAGGSARLRPRLELDDPLRAASMLAGILRAMGLVRDFAAWVLLAGHGSTTTNNPHAAGLDCGACGGQTGEVNARVLAALLNDPAWRAALAAHEAITIPDTTHFLAALHDTTTDDVELFDVEEVPVSHRAALAQVRGWLAEATRRARAERAPALGLAGLAQDADRLARRVRERAGDWSQVRPEWGLAGNAALIAAPRARSRHLDLGGRAFLHDYDWRDDPDGAVLTLILTAPMVVAGWINLQYLASTLDNRRYGSGDKVLHNVVGGCIGVFEGNGGDLRIGLPLQSLHDGVDWRHEPLRLAVFVEAPRAAIEQVAARHEVVRQLAGNGWLHLLRLDPELGCVEQWRCDGWASFATAQG